MAMKRFPQRAKPRRLRPELAEFSGLRKEEAGSGESLKVRRSSIPKKRKKPRRVGNGREKLYGEAKTARRREIFERSGGRCEAVKLHPDPSSIHLERRESTTFSHVLCNAPITWESMHWSHKAHGARKTDSLKGGLATCKDCHLIAEHNPKSCPRKPGRKMNQTECKEYLESQKCFCGQPKQVKSSFCFHCTLHKISDQQKHDLERLEGDEFIQCIADCEKTILRWRPAE